MTKPIGPRCNIDCKYCYYLEKEKLYPQEKKFRMSGETLERYVQQMIATSHEAGMGEVTFAWQGGEPLMLGLPFFEQIIELQDRHRIQGQRIANAIQTNGMLLNADWAAFFKRHGFLVGISIDGPKKVHDKYRVDRAGRSTFDAVMKGLEHLQVHQVDYNILTVVNRANAGKGKEIYKFLSTLGTDFFQFIPLVERRSDTGALASAPQVDMDPGNFVTDWSVTPKAYGKFLCDVFDVWYRRDVGQVYVQYFENQIGLWSGGPSSLCIYAETCGNGLAMEHNGDVYACDHYVYPEFKLGNINDEPLAALVWSDRTEAFGNAKRDALTAQCKRCRFRFACNGGCPKHRFLTSRDGEAGQSYFCESYQIFFAHAGERLRKLAMQFGY